MAIAKMKKVSLVAPVSDADGIIEVLQDVGVVEIEKTEIESDEYSLYDLSEVREDLGKKQEELSRALTELKFCIDFLIGERIRKISLRRSPEEAIWRTQPSMSWETRSKKGAGLSGCRTSMKNSQRSNEESRLSDIMISLLSGNGWISCSD